MMCELCKQPVELKTLKENTIPVYSCYCPEFYYDEMCFLESEKIDVTSNARLFDELTTALYEKKNTIVRESRRAYYVRDEIDRRAIGEQEWNRKKHGEYFNISNRILNALNKYKILKSREIECVK